MRVLIVGGGGHGRVVADAARAAGIEFAGPVSAGDAAALRQLVAEHACDRIHVAIGFNPTRETVAGMVASAGFPLAAIIHPGAAVGRGVVIGDGAAVLAGAVVLSDSIIGRGVIVNTRAALDRDCQAGDFSALSPGVNLGAGARIGARCWIGLGASIESDCSVGDDTVVGAGSVVTDDLPALVVAWGNPCRQVRTRNALDRYL